METNTSAIVFPYEVGPKEPEPVRLSELNALTQTRQAYDPEGIDELAQSMLERDENGVITGLKLINAPLVGRFAKESAEAYVNDLNDLFETSHTVDDLTPATDGNYFILVAGHRRTLALSRAVKLAGGTADELFVRTVVADDISFAEAFKDQTIENIHDRPPMQDEAEAIAKYCEFRRRSSGFGERLSVAQCARELSLKPKKVRNALKYAELPGRVKKYVNEGVLTYTDGVVMNDVQRAYRLREEQKPDANAVSVEERTHHLTETFALRVINRRSRKDVGERFGAKQFVAMVKGEVTTVLQDMYHQGGFELELEESTSPQAVRALAVARIANTVTVLAGIVAEQDPDVAQGLYEKLFEMLPDRAKDASFQDALLKVE